MSEPSADDALEQAVRRLERAIGQLEGRFNQLTGLIPLLTGLTNLLDASRTRERELAQAGEQASQALGRAIGEIRAALAQTQEPQPEKGAA